MASNIDASHPTAVTAYTQPVRDNFAAAKAEIEALEGKRPRVSGSGDLAPTIQGYLNNGLSPVLSGVVRIDSPVSLPGFTSLAFGSESNMGSEYIDATNVPAGSYALRIENGDDPRGIVDRFRKAVKLANVTVHSTATSPAHGIFVEGNIIVLDGLRMTGLQRALEFSLNRTYMVEVHRSYFQDNEVAVYFPTGNLNDSGTMMQFKDCDIADNRLGLRYPGWWDVDMVDTVFQNGTNIEITGDNGWPGLRLHRCYVAVYLAPVFSAGDGNTSLGDREVSHTWIEGMPEAEAAYGNPLYDDSTFTGGTIAFRQCKQHHDGEWLNRYVNLAGDPGVPASGVVEGPVGQHHVPHLLNVRFTLNPTSSAPATAELASGSQQAQHVAPTNSSQGVVTTLQVIVDVDATYTATVTNGTIDAVQWHPLIG